jgi:drug/metabolite transporter (DMT)-like permease
VRGSDILARRTLVESRFTAIALICVAVVFFAFLDTSAKYLTTVAHLPPFQVAWVRFASHVGLTILILGPRGTGIALRTRKLKHQLLRSLFMIGATGFNFAALQYLQLDQTATISFLSPFLVAALAGPLLDEWIGWRRLAAICVGFTGILFVTRPGFGTIHWAASLSFLSTLSYALYSISTRYLSMFDSARTTQTYTPLAGALFLAPFAWAHWQNPQSAWVWALLLSTGLLGGLGHWLLILAHERAPAPILAPFGYVNIVFMIALGYLVFSDIPSSWTLLGAGIMIASGIYLLFRERTVGGGAAPASSATVPEV